MISMDKPLNEYIRVRPLGKGAYGTVYEVQEDQDNHNSYALKIISKRKMSKYPYLFNYLQGEIGFMQKMKSSQHLVQLERWEQDDQYYYMLLEFCKGGDLFNLQLKQVNNVFPLDKATQILSHVIRGLQQIHQAGFLHRDIKLQNILVQTKKENNIFKLADFGFTKKENQISGTVLGTEYYMSPEVYGGQDYGYQVDMWSFGVLFYYMLNAQFPFENSNPNLPQSYKKQSLLKNAQNFSYESKVSKSKKKLIDNCTKQLENLFKKIFQIKPQKRINFFEIRYDPVFKKHFPQVNQKTSVIYKKGNISSIKIPTQLIPKRFQSVVNKLKQSKPTPENFASISKLTNPEYLFLRKKKEQLEFLIFNETIFRQCQLLNLKSKLSLSCHLLKYVLILIQNLLNQIHSSKFWSRLKKLKPGFIWQNYIKSQSFKLFEAEIKLQKCRTELLYQEQLQNCKNKQQQLLKENSKLFFCKKQEQYEIFINSYKRCFRLAYQQLLKCYTNLKQNEKSLEGSYESYEYIIILLLFTQIFDQMIIKEDKMLIIFRQFFNQKNIKSQSLMNSIYLQQLRSWLIKKRETNFKIYESISQKLYLSYS